MTILLIILSHLLIGLILAIRRRIHKGEMHLWHWLAVVLAWPIMAIHWVLINVRF